MAGTKKESSKRTLVRWSDDLDKQLLLSIQYACNEAGLRIPWDNVAKLMGDKFSDGAIVQHMSKLRQKMVENNLPVPPPLKRGTTVVPSKIYATSGTARRKSMPDTPTTTSTAITTPKPKGSARKRNRRSHSDSDSDSQVENMDIADSSDGEYGVSGRKKKKQPRQAKSKTAITKKTTMQESMEVDAANAEQVKEDDNSVKSQTVKEETIKESIESPGPATRTRGVRPDYSKLEQASDEEEAAVGDDDKDEDGEAGEDEEAMTEDETEDPKIKSDGEISPRSKVPASPATPAQLTNLPAYHDSPYSAHSVGTHTPYYGAPIQYRSPQNNFPGVPPTSYYPRSNMTSFSTNRNDSASSLSSSMPPAFSSHSSFSHAAMGQTAYLGHPDYLNHGDLDINDLAGFGHDMHHGRTMLRPEQDDEEAFGPLFDPNRQI